MSSKRKITIETRGPIRQKSGVVGPITIPYLEEEGIISRMILGGVKITEYLANGETRQLGSAHLHELNAKTVVLKGNKVQQADQTRIRAMADAEQERLAKEKEEALEKAKAELAAAKATTATETEQAKQLSKKERKEQARREAALKQEQAQNATANLKVEDDVEEK